MIEIEFFKDVTGKEPFTQWFNTLRDTMARIKLRQRLDRMTLGNFAMSSRLAKVSRKLKLIMDQGIEFILSI